MINKYKGKCLCGSCCYVITAEKPKFMYLCHCNNCRKETGSSYGANVFFEDAGLLWEQGKDSISYFDLKGTRKQCAFCKNCGSPLPRVGDSGEVVLPAGTIDEDSFLTPTAHIFYASRAAWEDKMINLKCFDEAPK